MPTTINGYHVFQIQCSVRELTGAIALSELENDLGDGYYDELLYGSETGTRRWALSFPTLPDGALESTTYTGINGEQLTRAEYLEDLFMETKVTGTPFVFQNPRNGGYYLVKFADPEYVFRKSLTKLYSAEVNLKQARIDGVTVLQPQEFSQVWGVYDAANFDLNTPYPFPYVGSVLEESGDLGDLSSDKHLDAAGTDVVAATVNGEPIVRFSNTTNNGFVAWTNSNVFYDIFLLMKMREATFSNNAGIVTADTVVAALVGASGTTKFFDFGFGANYQYRLNGVEYDENDQQAPMNTWGVVHIRHTDGFPIDNLQIGKDRDFAGRFAEMDLRIAVLSNSPLPKMKLREIDEMLNTMRSLLI